MRVDKSIQLIGEDRDITIIDAGGTHSPISLEKSGNTVSGFTLKNSGNEWYNDAGISINNWVHDSNNNIIIGNKILDNRDGIYLSGSNDNIISDNIILANRHIGMWFRTSNHHNQVINNTFINLHNPALALFSCSYNKFINNTFFNISDFGIAILESRYNEISWNEFNQTKTAIRLGPLTTRHEVYKNNIVNNTNGILVDVSDNVNIRTSNTYHTIKDNNFIENDVSIQLILGEKNRIEKNNFIKNNQHPYFVVPTRFKWFFFALILQNNYWNGNYWDDLGNSSKKTIAGEIWLLRPAWDFFNSEIYYVFFKSFETYDFDRFPVSEPYPLEV